jgi:NADP-dependent 3-hydroxy acid dehydrogenase YdfG
MAQKIWFITGVSSGFGKCLAEELVKAGEKVVGTLRQAQQVEAFNQQYAPSKGVGGEPPH